VTSEQVAGAIRSAIGDATAANGDEQQGTVAASLHQLARMADQVEGVPGKTGKHLRYAAGALEIAGDGEEAAKSLRTALAAVEKRTEPQAGKRKAA
jgi:hypothetical protein